MSRSSLAIASILLIGACDSVPPDVPTTPAPTVYIAVPDPSLLSPGRASAEGVVRDEEGRPIAGAFVLAQPATLELAIGTDENGHYSLDAYGLQAGINEITVAAEGYETQVANFMLRGQTRERIDFTLIPSP